MNTLNRFAIIALLSVFALGANAADKVHRVVFHVDDNDADRMNLVLNNVSNLNQEYQAKGEEAQIEVVTYGPGLTMLVEGKSPVAERVKSIAESYDNVSFKACGNTMKGMQKKTGKDVALLPQAQVVQAGVVHLVSRQEEGWSYIRP